MIPAEIFSAWSDILTSVVLMIWSNSLTSFIFGAFAVAIISNIIYRIASKGEPKDD